MIYVIVGALFIVGGILLVVFVAFWVGIWIILGGLFCALYGPLMTKKKLGCRSCRITHYAPAEMQNMTQRIYDILVVGGKLIIWNIFISSFEIGDKKSLELDNMLFFIIFTFYKLTLSLWLHDHKTKAFDSNWSHEKLQINEILFNF